MNPCRTPLTGCFALLLAAGASAGDWTPSAAPAMPGDAPISAPAQPSPEPSAPGMAQPPAYPPAGMPLPPQLPAGMTPPAGPFGTAGGEAAPEYDAQTGRTSFDVAGVRLVQSRTDDAYLLDIELRGLPAEQVEVRPAGNGLLLVVQRKAETSRAETSDNGYGYRRSWSYGSARSVKRLPAPPDADVLAMQREDTDDTVHISIPRRTDLSGYGAEVIPAQPGYQPAPAGMPQGAPQGGRP